MSFESLNLIPQLLKNIEQSGYTTPTPIQRATIPLVLEKRDVLGCAQTGTGKTAAFALPILQNLALTPKGKDEPRTIRALVLTPTRELAMQIYENFVMYGKKTGITPAVIFGGVSQEGQIHALHRGAEVVIACPGRLWDLMNQGYVRLDWVETFVLDEADRMLDMGFIHDVRRIAGKLPEKHQTLLFSATMPEEVEKLAMDLLHDPETVKVDPVSSPVEAIDQCLYYVDKVNKRHLLAKLLREEDVENALVFSRTKHGVDRIVRDLKRAGIQAAGIHGDKSQAARQNALNSFKAGEVKVLVATDIAARGIDIAGLSHVFNYDQPMEPEAYVHRIGRTGRAGRTGKAISFCCIDELKQLGQVEKLIHRKLPLRESEWPMEVTTPTPPKPRGPIPTKVNIRGEAMPEKKPRHIPGRPAAPAKAPAQSRAGNGAARSSGHTLTIGRNGKVIMPGEAKAPAPAPRSKAPAARVSTHGNDARRSEPRHGRPQTGTGRPVRRVNRDKR